MAFSSATSFPPAATVRSCAACCRASGPIGTELGAADGVAAFLGGEMRQAVAQTLRRAHQATTVEALEERLHDQGTGADDVGAALAHDRVLAALGLRAADEIGRASCRERV